MELKPFRFRVLRYRPGVVDPPRFQTFELSLGARDTVLDGLERIRRGQDPSLVYRHSCHHSSCGTCACRINGVERLACVTRVQDLEGEEVRVEPLARFPVVADLLVDMEPFYRNLGTDWTHLRACEGAQDASTPDGVSRYERFENCIECGACVSACPVTGGEEAFLGPAVLAALNRQAKNHPSEASELLARAGREDGVDRCERALNCSRVCPAGVYPARHIHDLKRAIRRGGEEE